MEKIRTNLSFNSGLTGETRASVTPEKIIPGKKRNIKSIAASPPRKEPIPNQNKNTLGLQTHQYLPPYVPQFPPGFKSFKNEANGDNNETTDISCTDKDNMSHTNQNDYIEYLKATKNTNDDDEYKEDNSKHQDSNESCINRTK